ncbi:MAG: thermonuclease family protein [Candidatus Omnitrophica bacterium]|nr:thermonuclease family protein [Candidatus Omnitrophota bacterium]
MWIFALTLTSLLYSSSNALTQSEAAPSQDKFLYVRRVIDGDTIKLSDGQKVRLIGIDTPESYYSDKLLRDSKRSRKDIKTILKLGKRASSFTRELCLGKKVRLEYDVVKKDRYGRTLAYVYLENGTFVNAKILEEGYAQVMTVPPNVKYADYFLRIQGEARDKNKGLWSREVENG